MALYRAIRKGQSSDGVWRQPGEEFSDSGPQGRWMELIGEPEKAPRKPKEQPTE